MFPVPDVQLYLPFSPGNPPWIQFALGILSLTMFLPSVHLRKVYSLCPGPTVIFLCLCNSAFCAKDTALSPVGFVLPHVALLFDAHYDI